MLKHGMSSLAVIAAASLLTVVGAGSSDAGVGNRPLPYADTGWVTLHGDAGNRREQMSATPAADYSRWTALEGATLLTAPVIAPNGNIVVTTGKAEGNANLHMLDRNGATVWDSQPWNGKAGVDSGAVISSPIVDENGDIFISDSDQLWSYSSDGRVRWVIDLPPAPTPNPFAAGSRSINPFVTAIFTKDGAVMGTTAFGQVVVADRATGALRAPVFQLPGTIAARSTAQPMSPSLWSNGLMDPAIIDPIYQIILGSIVRSANTPAIDSKTGRVFIAATAANEGRGALYGLDVTPPRGQKQGEVKIAFATEMGPGSGSSPVLSPDARRVYTCDDAGVVYAFDTKTGKTIWTAPSDGTAAAFSVAPNGSIYVLTNPGVLTAFSDTGTKLWDADLSAQAAAALPVNDTYGKPIVRGNGNPTVVNGAVLVPVFYGYEVPAMGHQVSAPIKSAIVEIDPTSGKGRRDLAYATDTSEGIIAVAPDGRMFATMGSITSSSTASLAALANAHLPADLQMIKPTGGLNGFTPRAKGTGSAS
ncbi:PQQ-binding-like beta-propeller repeat protein [Nocardia sp. NPDC005825]|uniref:outer membrane protein assembly factor BamB family protein n=1 Tax=unclassified Nocardia TaxID=2637762 RepID=UPI0034034AEA